MKTIPFSNWTFEDVEDVFGLKETKEHSTLNEWLNCQYELSELERIQLEAIKGRLQERALEWNGADLKFYLLGPLMFLVNYDTDEYKSFSERQLSISIDDNTQAAGKVDFLVARGRLQPRSPYFFLHEYKKEIEAKGEPLGQLLVSMVAAQNENPTHHPILGAYVIGRLFFFVILDEKEYTKSLAFDATQDDLFQIFAVLKKVKEYIQGFMNAEKQLAVS